MWEGKSIRVSKKMESVSYDGRPSVNWSHPMNNFSHLPPKSPAQSYSMFSSGSLFESSSSSAGHRRSPSAGYVAPAPHGQQAWLSDRLGSPDVILKKCSHRRSSSDSVAFVDTSYQYMNYLENVTEDEEFVLPALPAFRPAHRRGLSADHGSSGDHSLPYQLPATTHRSYPEKATRGDQNITREHFSRVREIHEPFHEATRGDHNITREHFSRVREVHEPFQRQQQQQQQQQARHENLTAAYGCVGVSKAKSKHTVSLATLPNLRIDSSSVARGGGKAMPTIPTSFENRSTASESNSHSDDSNDEARARSYEIFRASDSEVRSEEGGDGSPQSQEGACTSTDPVDPKKAKRILANKQSAQRSRVRKLQYISELEMNVNLLETEVAALSPKVGYYDHERALLSAENALLKQKLAALAKTERLKEAYNETLKTEVQRLRQICNQQAQQFSQQQPLSPDSLDLQLVRFSKLDLGPPKIPPTAYTRRPSLYPTTKVISPNNNNNNNNNATRASPQRAFMVHNS